jgi:hypothetical protein
MTRTATLVVFTLLVAALAASFVSAVLAFDTRLVAAAAASSTQLQGTSR